MGETFTGRHGGDAQRCAAVVARSEIGTGHILFVRGAMLRAEAEHNGSNVEDLDLSVPMQPGLYVWEGVVEITWLDYWGDGGDRYVYDETTRPLTAVEAWAVRCGRSPWGDGKDVDRG